jgi:hypothetical protein
MPARFDRGQQDLAHPVVPIADRHQIPVSEARQQAPGRAVLDAQHDQPHLVVHRIVRYGVQPLGLAVLAGEIFIREQRNDPGSGR